MNRFVIQFRAGQGPATTGGLSAEGGAAPTASVLADRVQGWSHDYAFFSDKDNPKVPLWIFPRDVVLSVWRADHGE